MDTSTKEALKKAIENGDIIGVELDENGEPKDCCTPVELFDEIDCKFVDFYGEYGRRMVNARRER